MSARLFESSKSVHSSIKTRKQFVADWRSREWRMPQKRECYRGLLLFTSSSKNMTSSQIMSVSFLQQQERSPSELKGWWTLWFSDIRLCSTWECGWSGWTLCWQSIHQSTILEGVQEAFKGQDKAYDNMHFEDDEVLSDLHHINILKVVPNSWKSFALHGRVWMLSIMSR